MSAMSSARCCSSRVHRTRRLAMLALLGLLLIAGLSMAAERGSQSRMDEQAALASFDQVWERVRDQYFDYGRIQQDWEQAREQLRPLAAEAATPAALRGVLNQLLALIGESHFGIIPGETFERLIALEAPAAEPVASQPRAARAATGLTVRWIDEAVRVSGLRTDGPAARAGIELGWSVTAVDDFDIPAAMAQIAAIEDELVRRRAVTRFEYALQQRLSYPQPEQDVGLELLTSSGELQRHTLRGVLLRHETVQIGHLPPMNFDFSLERFAIPAGCVSVIAFSTWVPALIDEFQQRRDEIFACQGLLFDLRGNPGGILATMVTLASDLFDESALLGTLLRSDARLDFRVFPRRVAMDGTRLTPYSGPIAILIDGMSASTSELFAAGMQATGRARLFGQRSAGEALPSRTMPLASGDFLYYAFADIQDSLGRRVEGVGVQPDEPVQLSADNIDMQPGPAMQAALNWIDSQLHP